MTGAKKKDNWHKAKQDELKSLWADGYSAAECGRLMNISRNAVIGKVYRMGLRRRGKGQGGRPHAPKKPTLNGGRRQTNFNLSIGQPRDRTKVVRPPLMIVIPTEITPLNGVGITLLEMAMDQCHAVIKEPSRRTKELARYCGNRTYNGTAYCEGHFNAFHQPPRLR